MYFVNPPCMKQGCNQNYYQNNPQTQQNEPYENAMSSNQGFMNMQYPSSNYYTPTTNYSYPMAYPVDQNDLTSPMPMPMPPVPQDSFPNNIPSFPDPQNTGSAPETLTDIYFTPGFLKTQIGKTMRVEFLMGTNAPLVDRIGVLLAVGASYILLRPIQTQEMLMCDIYSIKFVTILK